MSSIAIITDSNSGITQEEAKKMGIYVVPMPFLIDEKDYYEDVNLTQEEFYQKMQEKVNVSTSQPSPEEIMKVWDAALQEHEKALYIPMSSGLSGTCATAIMLAEDYEGKVFVVDNQRISVTQKNSVMDACNLVKEGHDIQSIYNVLMETKLDASIYIMVDTLKYLRKGGRITPAVAALGTILRIKPVLQIQGERLDTFAKARTVKQGMSIMVKALQDDMEKRFHNDLEGTYINIAHTQNEKGVEELKEEIWKIYPGIEIMTDPLSLSVSCHIGPGALAVAMAKKAKIVTV